MAYYTEITSSQTWTCPHTGDYKITCVAGGGGINKDYVVVSGGSTSFGSYMTCSGHIVVNKLGNVNFGNANIAVTGYVPARPDIYATPCTCTAANGNALFGTAIGYGCAASVEASNKLYFSLCGNLERKIVHLEKGAKISCTIGAGGVIAVSSPKVTAPSTGGFISIQEV